jgi:hypothetical protein
MLLLHTKKELLRCVTQTAQILSNRTNRHLYLKQVQNQLLRGPARPQSERELESIRRFFSNHFQQPFFLIPIQRSATAYFSTPLSTPDPLDAMGLVGLEPFAGIGRVNTDNITYFFIGFAGLAKSDNLVAQLLLDRGIEFAGIYSFRMHCGKHHLADLIAGMTYRAM